jgi:hypothetical protein
MRAARLQVLSRSAPSRTASRYSLIIFSVLTPLELLDGQEGLPYNSLCGDTRAVHVHLTSLKLTRHVQCTYFMAAYLRDVVYYAWANLRWLSD